MFVGEQPGDEEDKAGHPFVGPSGRLLDAALEAAGIPRDSVYVTNAVKHFKFVRRELTQRRLHKKPSVGEVRACRPWLAEEIRLTAPRLIVVLGSTAAQALLGRSFRVTKGRGQVVQSEWGPVIATVHPSSVLRAPPDAREEARQDFFHDILQVAKHLGASGARRPRSHRAVR